MNTAIFVAKLGVGLALTGWWLWFLVTQVPLLLTGGTFAAFTAVGFLALSLLLVIGFIHHKVKGKSNLKENKA